MKTLNHIYRTIWSEALGAWVAVSEITKAKGKRSGAVQPGRLKTGAGHATANDIYRHRLTLLFGAVVCSLAVNAQANPIGGSVVSGQASFNSSGTTLTVTNTPGTIINWQGFSIQQNEITRFAQQSASSTVLNRVISNSPSSILGALQSNGRVFLVNPNGIVFGAGSTVDVAGLVATSLNLSDADFQAGRYNFTAMPGAQALTNAGNISAQSGGEIYLIAPNVENSGVISAPNGEILLVAGHEVQLVNTLDPNLRVNIVAPAGDATNVGRLVADSGSLGLFGTVLRNSGQVSADSATMQGGKIVFKASQRVELGGTISANGTSGGSVNVLAAHAADPNSPSVVVQSSSIQANGATGAGGSVVIGADSILATAAINVDGATVGGQISVQAANRALSTSAAQYTANSSQGRGGDILLSADVSNYTSGSYSATGMSGGSLTLAGNEIKLAGAQLDASGTNGGGTIHVGGLMHGAAGFGAQGVALANANNVLTSSTTRFKADALQTGNGGEVVLWSDQAMSFRGGISARGGAAGGNGGSAEVSGLTSLGYSGLADLSATNGVNGTLLLDPHNITIVAGNGALAGTPYQEILDPTPGAGEGFGGWQNLVLANGNIVISSPLDSAFGANSGAVYFYTPGGSLMSALVGAAAGDKVGGKTYTNGGVSYDYGGLMLLGSGNVLVSSNNWNGTAGAVTWMSASGLLSDGSTGGTVSAINSLVGSTAGDKIGTITTPYCCGTYDSGGVLELNNGNVVVSSNNWTQPAGAGPALAKAGAVTWLNGATGKLADGTNGGAVSAANSLLGGAAGDQVGSGGITQASNGTFFNYLVSSPLWGSAGIAANALGAVTWMNGATGQLSTAAGGGTLSGANSLVGSVAGDKVGTTTVFTYSLFDVNGISVGANGNLLVGSNNWNSYRGAVTWMNGATGTLADASTGGALSAINSLVGTAIGDKVGTFSAYNGAGYSDNSGLRWLANGNFVISSGLWGSGGVSLNAMGAVTWGSGTAGVVGAVSSANSIVGATTGDRVGGGWTDAWTNDPGLVVLPNSNYVVVSSRWNGGMGAVTWGNGATGTSGSVSGIQTAGNASSLVGNVAGSYVGAQGITVQLGGSNYVVRSPWYDFNTLTDIGAVTWMNGTTGALSSGALSGAVDGTNSLMGTFALDNVGAVMALNNGNFLATTPVWNGGSPSTGLGAYTWISGATGKLADGSNGGPVSAANSLVGSTAADTTGSSISELGNGNLLVFNPNWDNGAAANAGAVTWMNGATGLLADGTAGGVIAAGNSVVGSSAGDTAGQGNGAVHLSNGNVLIRSGNWSAAAGAVTWMNSATGALADGTSGGVIAASNSLIGTTAWDNLSSGGVIQLGNGKVVISSPYWTNPAAPAALYVGAVTWMDAANGKLSDNSTGGAVTATNSLIGVTAYDQVGASGVDVVTDNQTYWNYVVRSSSWNSYAGAITWVNGATGKTSDNSGFISSANSLVGSATVEYVGTLAPLVLGNGNVVFANLYWNDGAVTYAGAVTWMNGATGQLMGGAAGGVISSSNSLIGSTGWDQLGSGGLREVTDGLTFWNYVVLSPYWNNGAGAVTLGNGVTGSAGVVSASNSLVGGVANDAVGSGGITLLSNGQSYWNYVVHSPGWGGAGVAGAGMGAVTWVNGQTGQLTTGAVGGMVGSTNSLVGSTAGDQVGVAQSGYSNALGGVNVLGNGHLLIRSQYWNGQFSAITWMSGATGKLVGGANGGVVSASNSLLGSTIYDNLGGGATGVTPLVNGNWVITSPAWGGGGLQGMGAATWMNGSTGQLANATFGGVVSAGNSFVGTFGGDVVGGDYWCDCANPAGGITALSDGNYVINSPDWGYRSLPYTPATGAVTWGNGVTGRVGTVSAGNSVFGVVGNVHELGITGQVLIASKTANGGAGGVYLLGGANLAVNGPLFADSPNADGTIGANWIAAMLNANTNVVLQANNDINQQAGAGITAMTGNGNLTLQAGRSVVLNDTIDISGSLNLSANDAAANLAYRGAGSATLDTFLASLTAGVIDLNNAGGDILAGSMTATTGAINLKATNNILLGAGRALATPATAINLVSDADVAGGGGIYLAAGSSVNSNGGNIRMGGMPSLQRAIGNGSVTGGVTFNSGIYVLGDIVAGAGSVTLFGQGAAGVVLGDGITLAGGTLGSNGTVTLDGVSPAWHADPGLATMSDFVAGVHFMNAGTRLSTATGTVNVTGVNTTTGVRAQGINIDAAIVETTGSGTLTLNGTAQPANGNPNTNWGVALWNGGTVRTTAAAGGAVTLIGAAPVGDGGVVAAGGNVVSGGGEIRMIALSGGLGLASGALVGGLNSGNILLQVSGASLLDIGSSLNAGGSVLTLSLGGGTVNDNNNTITAGALRLLGTGTFNLGGSGNNVATVAGNVNGVVNYNDTDGFSIATVSSFDGAAVSGTAGLTATGNIGLTAGGAITATGTVSTPATLSTSSVGGTMLTGANSVGTYTAVNAGSGNIGFNNTGALNLGSVANPVGSVNVQATGNLLLTAAVSSGATGDAVVMATGGNFNTGTGALTLSATPGSSRWLIYSTTPAANTLGTLVNTYDFQQYNSSYGSLVQGGGNGLIYTFAPTLTASLTGTSSKLYDGTITATLTAANYLLGGALNSNLIGTGPDTLGINSPGSGQYDTQNAGVGKIVTASGYTVNAVDSGGKPVYGYSLPSPISAAIGDISPATLTVAGVPANKVLGTPDPLLTFTVSGIQLNDSAAGLFTGALVRDPGETIGSYQVNVGSLALNTANPLSANYNFSALNYVPCTFTILAPTVVQEITQISLLNSPQGQTATTSAEEEKREAAQIEAAIEARSDAGGAMAEPLPVCR